MNTTDKKGTLRRLVEIGKAKGRLSNQEILDTLAEINFSPEQLEKLYDKLEENGIEVVEDSVGEESFDDLSSESDSQSYDASFIDDPVKMYLREIGKIEMLTPEEEQDIARGKPSSGCQYRQAVSRQRHASARSDSGGQFRAHQGCG